MTKLLIPDRSAEPALQESLDRGPQSHTGAQSEDVARDAGKAPRASKPGEPQDDPTTKPDAQEVEELTGVPSSSEELSQM